MNPTALIVLLIAIVAVIVAIRGTQDNFVAAIEGHAPSWAGGAAGASSSGGAPKAPSFGTQVKNSDPFTGTDPFSTTFRWIWNLGL